MNIFLNREIFADLDNISIWTLFRLDTIQHELNNENQKEYFFTFICMQGNELEN